MLFIVNILETMQESNENLSVLSILQCLAGNIADNGESTLRHKNNEFHYTTRELRLAMPDFVG